MATDPRYIGVALGTFRSMIEFDNGSSGKLTTITVTSSEPNCGIANGIFVLPGINSSSF